MIKLTDHAQTVEDTIANLTAAQLAHDAKADAEREALQKRLEKQAAELEPMLRARNELRDQLTALMSRRAELEEQLRIGRGQLSRQSIIAEDFNGIMERNFGHHAAERNPGVFLDLLSGRPAGLLAALAIIPALHQWIPKKEAELSAVDAELAELAATAQKRV